MWLRQQLTERKQRNPGYSLRAFARQSGLSPATLSLILQGKRRLTPKLAKRLSERLCLPPDKRRALLEATANTWGPPPLDESLDTVPTDEDFLQLESDVFASMADWTCYAVMALAQVTQNEATPLWISNRLGISPRKADEALQRLLRLRLVKKTRTGRFRLGSKPVTTSQDLANSAIRSYHHQILNKAQEALDLFPVEQRDFSSYTVAADPKNLPQAKKFIEKFRRRLAAMLADGKPEKVYTVAIQLFSLEPPVGN